MRPSKQSKLHDFFPQRKRQSTSSSPPYKRPKVPTSSLPVELLLCIAKCLSLFEAFVVFAGVCRTYREAVRALGQCQEHFALFSSTLHAGADYSLRDFLLVVASQEPAFETYRGFFRTLGVSSRAEAKHFWKQARFRIHADTVSPLVCKSVKLRHASIHGDLLIPAGALAAICQKSRQTLVEVCFLNCLYLDSRVTAALASCERLEVLNLSHSSVSDEVLQSAPRALKTLILRGCQSLTAAAVQAVSVLPNLRQVDLSYCFQGDTPPLQPLARLSLTHLILEGLVLGQEAFSAIKCMSSLAVLSLKDTIGLTDYHLHSTLQPLAALKQLNIEVSPPASLTEGAVFALVCQLNLEVLRAPVELLSPRVQSFL